MSNKIIRQCVGIDVAQKELVVCLGRKYDDWDSELFGHKTFTNNEKGYLLLLAWVKKLTEQDIGIRFVMEATGVYHDSLAYFLDEKGYELSIVLPNKISNYARSLDTKTVTDRTSSEAIALFGLERKLDKWKRPKPVYKKLRQLSRERDQVVQARTVAKNQLHAENAEAEPNRRSVGRLKKQIELLNKMDAEIRSDMDILIKGDNETGKHITIISSCPGIGKLTAAIILAETNGFELIRNRKQLASYAGFDVKEKQSGTSVRGKARISKKGNKHLRKAMHLPSLAAIRHDDRFKSIFSRLISRHGIKMKAAVAVQRKLLELAYTLFKNQVRYDKSYLEVSCLQEEGEPS
jgi:transposase